jgi:GT2 family glycosyltransferase
LILNQDAYVQKDTISELVRSLEARPDNGIACPIQFDEITHKMTWGGSLDAFPAGVHNCTDLTILEKDMFTYWANGAAMLLRMEMVRSIGIFDQNMRFICSDADYSFTARARGWNIIVSSRAKLFHGFDGSHSLTNLHLERVKLEDMRYFANKWLTGGVFKALSYEGPRLREGQISEQMQAIDNALLEVNALIDPMS